MKCFLLVNKSESVLNFRGSLIRELKSRGHWVGVIAQDDERLSDIETLGIRFYCVRQDNRGMNPFSILRYFNEVRKILGAENPDTVFTFQVKANTFGVFAARAAGIRNIFSMVEGAGDVFIKQSLPWKLIRLVICLLYRMAFSFSRKVFFLNREDKAEFRTRKLVPEEKCVVIPGIGVDLERFAQQTVTDCRSFLMVARLHREKGVMEYCECARQVKKQYPDASFSFLGPEREIKAADIQSYLDDGSVTYLGAVSDVRPYLHRCGVLVLPSYREGVPMSVMEAEAVGRAILTTDVPGCRDTVKDGFNGFLVPVRDADAMAEKCVYFLEHPEEVVRMGQNSRRFAEEHFDQKMINAEIIGILEQAEP